MFLKPIVISALFTVSAIGLAVDSNVHTVNTDGPQAAPAGGAVGGVRPIRSATFEHCSNPTYTHQTDGSLLFTDGTGTLQRFSPALRPLGGTSSQVVGTRDFKQQTLFSSNGLSLVTSPTEYMLSNASGNIITQGQQNIGGAAISGNGARFALVTYNVAGNAQPSTFSFFNSANGQVVASGNVPGNFYNISLNHAGTYAVGTSNGSISLLSPNGANLQTTQLAAPAVAANELRSAENDNLPMGFSASSTAFSPNGNQVMVVYSPYYDKAQGQIENPPPSKVVVYDLATGRAARNFTLPGKPSEIVYSNDGTHIVAKNGRGIGIYDATNGRQVSQFAVNDSLYLQGLRVSPDGAFVSGVVINHDQNNASSTCQVYSWPMPGMAANLAGTFEELFQRLGSDNVGTAMRAAYTLSSDPANRARIQTALSTMASTMVSAEQRTAIQGHLGNLGNAVWRTRHTADSALRALIRTGNFGMRSYLQSELQRVATNRTDLESARRAEQMLSFMGPVVSSGPVGGDETLRRYHRAQIALSLLEPQE